ncbi:hypothetical protein HNY73_000088 [Argiope bruennichi]|nr:hypothetical protein HNY73_000088 [Argiope bruennichi]
MSPFLIQKYIQSTTGNVTSVKKLRSGDLLIESATPKQSEQLLSIKNFGDAPIEVSGHKTLNYTRGVISSMDLIMVSDEEFVSELQSFRVTSARRITLKRDEARKIVESRTPKENLPYSTALKRTTCSSMQTEPIQIQENSSPSQTISKPFPSPSNEEYITIKLKDWLEIVKSNKSSIIKEKNITKNQKALKTVPQNKKKKKNLSIQNENEQKEKINVNKDVQLNIQQTFNSTSSKEVELEIHPSDESLSEMDLSDEARVGTAKPKVFKSKFFRKPK